MKKRLKNEFCYAMDIASSTYTAEEGIDNAVDYLLEQGVLIPPVRVGQKVYILKHNLITPHKTVELIYCSNRGVRPFIYKTNLAAMFDNCDIGDTVFLTPEEAEKALAERQSVNEV